MGSSPPHKDLSTEELFRRFAPFVARFLYRLGVRSDGLDDLVQEVFLVVHRRGGYKAGPAKPTSYLATIATNAASAYRRKQRVEQARSSDTEVEGLVSTSREPVQVMEVAERLRLLQATLDRLEPEFRSMLILADIEGETCASIAASSGVPTGTVYWRLHEARKRFQRALRAEMAGIPARTLPVDDRALASESRERSPALALAVAPLWLLSGARRLLREGAAHPPVRYDVEVGLEQHRQLAGSAAAPSWAPPTGVAGVAGQSSAGVGIVGVSAVGVAAVVVALLHSTPRPPTEERAVAAAVAAPATAVEAASAVASRASAASATQEAAQRANENEHTASPPARASDSNGASPSSRPGPGPSSGASISSRTTSKRSAPPSAQETSRVSSDVEEPAIPEPRPTEAPTASSVAANDAPVEAREIARAERMLSSDPAGALAIARGARARFKPSFLPEERDYVEVMALAALGRTDDVKAAASRFLAAYPGGAFSNRVRGVLGR